MNTIKNKRYDETEKAIGRAVFTLLNKQGYDEFSVKDVCETAGVNRSSFYAHFQDINDLMIKLESYISNKIKSVIIDPVTSSDKNYFEEYFVNFFTVIKEYKVFYKAFLKSGNPSFDAPNLMKESKEKLKQLSQVKGFNYTDDEIDYHLHYFGGGLKAVTALWIHNDCKQSPEQMAKIMHDEYANNMKFFG